MLYNLYNYPKQHSHKRNILYEKANCACISAATKTINVNSNVLIKKKNYSLSRDAFRNHVQGGKCNLDAAWVAKKVRAPIILLGKNLGKD